MLSTRKYVKIDTANNLRRFQLELIKYIREVGRQLSIPCHRRATVSDFNAGLQIIAQYATSLARMNHDKTTISKTQVRSLVFLFIPSWDGAYYCVLPTRIKYILDAIRRLTIDNVVNPGQYLHNMQFTADTTYVDFAINPQRCAILALDPGRLLNQGDLQIVADDIQQHHTSHQIRSDWK